MFGRLNDLRGNSFVFCHWYCYEILFRFLHIINRCNYPSGIYRPHCYFRALVVFLCAGVIRVAHAYLSLTVRKVLFDIIPALSYSWVRSRRMLFSALQLIPLFSISAILIDCLFRVSAFSAVYFLQLNIFIPSPFIFNVVWPPASSAVSSLLVISFSKFGS